MSNIKYLEIDSTYRDRTLWPEPADFEMLISQTGRKGRLTASDPVSLAAPIKMWTSNAFAISSPPNPAVVLTLGAPPIVTDASGQTVVIATGVPGELQKSDGYYNGAIAISSILTVPALRILSYAYLGIDSFGNDMARLSFTSAAPTPLTGTLTINDPTDLSNDSNPFFFVPKGPEGDNSFSGDILWNDTLGQWRRIIDYDSVTHLVAVDTSGSILATTESGPITGWLSTHTYSIRPEAPRGCAVLSNPAATLSKNSFILPAALSTPDFQGGFLEIPGSLETTTVSPTSGAGTTTSVVLSLAASTVDDFYTGCTLTMTGPPAVAGQSRLINGYVGATRTASFLTPLPIASALADTLYIECPDISRRVVKYVQETGAAVAGTIASISLPSSASNIQGDYTGLFIRITGGLAAGDVSLITEYNVTTTGGITTRTAVAAFSAVIAPGDTYEIMSGLVSPAFPFSLTGKVGCVLLFSYDNANPFCYNGSTVSQQEMVCYEIQLINLILPNSTLGTGEGSRIAFYPYVYVHLSNVSSAGSGGACSIYSNNPHSTRMTFRVAITDIPNPLLSSFIKLSGNGMTQTLKFKPNDNLKFSVHLPNGEIYNTVLEEQTGPNQPEPLNQISALFGIKRL